MINEMIKDFSAYIVNRRRNRRQLVIRFNADVPQIEAHVICKQEYNKKVRQLLNKGLHCHLERFTMGMAESDFTKPQLTGLYLFKTTKIPRIISRYHLGKMKTHE